MMTEELWIDTRLSQEEMDFLNQAIGYRKIVIDSEDNTYNSPDSFKGEGSGRIEDKDNWFFKSTLEKLTERLFYNDWGNYRKYHILKNESPPEFEMERFWVNYQYQHEFNPLHNHTGLYSFVIFMKIPTHSKEQHELHFSSSWRVARMASDFVFVRSEPGKTGSIINIPLSPEDEGRMLFFPAWLHHQVYPFYGTEEERITISGNVDLLEVPEKEFEGPRSSAYEDKEKILKTMENSVRVTKEELKMMIINDRAD